MRRSAGAIGPERGSASVLVVAVVASTLIVLTAALTLVGAALAGHRARSAADLASVAAATRLVARESGVCETAREVAARNHASLVACEVRGEEVQVLTEVRAPAGWGAVRAESRAGPGARP